MFEKPNKLHSVILGGLIIGAISGIPGLNLLNCCCCAGILLGGAMSVYLYRQEFTNEMPPMESSDALILGIVAGIIGAIIATFLSSLVTLVFGQIENELVRNLLDKLENRGTIPQNLTDKLRDQFEQAIKEGSTIGGILRSLIFALILYPIFSMLGGLIGFGIFGKKKPTIPPQPPLQQ
jgi:hypothetical protein